MTAALAGTLAVTGCGTEAAHRRAEPESAPQARTSPPAAAVTVLADETAGALALAVSQQLYDHAPVVVLAAEDDPDSQSLRSEERRVGKEWGWRRWLDREEEASITGENIES